MLETNCFQWMYVLYYLIKTRNLPARYCGVAEGHYLFEPNHGACAKLKSVRQVVGSAHYRYE